MTPNPAIQQTETDAEGEPEYSCQDTWQKSQYTVYRDNVKIDAHQVNQNEYGAHEIQIGDKSSQGGSGAVEIRLVLQTLGLYNCRP